MTNLNREFNFDFDPCPYPRPNNFDGLTEEWGQSNYVNPPFEDVTAWVRKAIAENRKGKGVVLVLPVQRWLHRLIDAGAIMRNLGDVKWQATEDGSPGKGTGEIVAFILEPPPKNSKDIAG